MDKKTYTKPAIAANGSAIAKTLDNLPPLTEAPGIPQSVQ
jgi:hypothetical protein